MATILCVEDEDFVREDIVEELMYNGYEVLEAGDGREGLEMILKHKPDLVICDVTMPRMNGHELVKTLREEHSQSAETPFIFLSALVDPNDILEGLVLGADDYLTKPIDMDMLMVKIKTSLRQVARITAKKSSN